MENKNDKQYDSLKMINSHCSFLLEFKASYCEKDKTKKNFKNCVRQGFDILTLPNCEKYCNKYTKLYRNNSPKMKATSSTILCVARIK